jgi:DNA-directed RNA polymerase subunit RPC12/RpoP
MWCFECEKEFTSNSNLEDTCCTICESPIVEKIEEENDIQELQSQEVLVRTNGKLIFKS